MTQLNTAAGAGLTVFEYDEFVLRHFVPRFVVSQRLRGDHRDAVIGRGVFGKINADVRVLQVRIGKRVLTHDVVQIGGAVRPHRLTIGQAEIECTVLRDLRDNAIKRGGDFGDRRRIFCRRVGIG